MDIVCSSADDLGAAGWDTTYGSGRVNAARAVAIAVATGTKDTTPPSVTVTAPANLATVSGTVTISATASDNVGVSSVAFYIDGVLSGTCTAAPFSLTWSTPAAINGSHTIKAIASDAAGNSSSAQISVTVSNQAPGSGGTTVRLDSGGAGYNGTSGNFAPDSYCSGGFSYIYPTRNILNTIDDTLYLSVYAGTAIGYSIPVENATYSVKLHFAECSVSGLGNRLFNVSMNGSPVLTNFDIFATAGGMDTPVVKSFTVKVTNGMLNINFQSVVGNAVVAAVEVVPTP